MKYPDMTWSRMQAVIDKLGGMESVQRFLSGELVVKMVKRFVIWNTVTLGTYKSSSEYRKALKADGYCIGGYADQILNKVKVSETMQQLDLVTKTAAELGFKNDVTRKQIYDRAIKLGLELCPAEVGPALRLQYSGQPYWEWLHIAMEPIAASGGRLKVFAVVRDFDGGRELDGCYDYPVWDVDNRWVFVAPRE